MVGNRVQGLQVAGKSLASGSGSVSERVRVADVLDQLKADHLEDTIDPVEATMLVSLTEGLIRGSRSSRRSRLADVLGPVVKPGVASTLLGISTTALDKRRDSGAVLGVRTETGRWVYPLAQFRVGDRGGVEVLAGLRNVLTVLLASGDGLAAARWLATPNRRLAADTPWEALTDQSRQTQVVAAASAQADASAGR